MPLTLFQFLLGLLTTLALTGCKDTGGKVEGSVTGGITDNSSQTPVGSSWNFSNSADYTFASNFVTVAANKATLKTVNSSFTNASTFNQGTYIGTIYSGSSIKLQTAPANELGPAWAPEWSSILAYWKLNEASWNGSSGEVIDFSGNGNDGRATGSVSTAAGKLNNAGVFSSATQSVITSPSSTFIPSSNSPITITAWINPTSIAAGASISQSIVAIHRIATASSALRLGLGNTNKLGFYNSADASIVFSTGTITTGQWSHVALSYNGTCFQLYINGAVDGACLVKSLDQGGSFATRLGNFDSSSLNLEGKLDEVVIWNKGLTASQILNVYSSQSQSYLTELSPVWTPHWNHLVGYWKMDGDWVDASTKGNNGTGNNGATWTTPAKVGSNTGSFDGTNDYVEVAAGVGSNYSTAITIMFWLKANSTAQGAVNSEVAYKTNGVGWIILRDNATQKIRFRTDTSASADQSMSSSKNVFDGNWHHVAMTISGINKYIYIDGTLDSSSTFSPGTGFGEATAPLWLGKGNTTFLNGLIDDFSLFSVPFAGSDVALVYNRQKQKYSGSYDSPIIDLGVSGAAAWTSLTSATPLPFMKELPASTASETTTSYPSIAANFTLNLRAYWSLDELALNGASAGNDFEDRSSNSFHGAESGGVTVGQSGQLGNSAKFDGVDDTVSVGSLGNFSGGFSAGGWIQSLGVNAATSTQVIISQRSTVDNYDFQLNMNNAMTQLRCYFENATTSFSAPFTVAGGVLPGVWYHLLCVFDPTAQTLTPWVNGVAGTPLATGAVAPPTGGVAYIGSNNGTTAFWNGYVDELAAWNRVLTQAEIIQFYRRGANRIKYQFRSCADSACSCKTISASGTASDCSGNGTSDDLTSSDPQRASWIGPDGTGTTYFSELQNNASVDASGNPTGAINAGGLTLNWSTAFFTAAARPAANRYFQYRIYMESEDENTLCSGAPCMPEVTSIVVGPVGRYYGGSPTVVNSTALSYSQLHTMTKSDSGSCTTYQVSIDGGANWKWWDSAANSGAGGWSATTGGVSNSNYLSDFTTARLQSLGSGNYKFKAFLTTNTSGDFLQACELSSVGVTYTP